MGLWEAILRYDLRFIAPKQLKILYLHPDFCIHAPECLEHRTYPGGSSPSLHFLAKRHEYFIGWEG